jgi:hypothetical protein
MKWTEMQNRLKFPHDGLIFGLNLKRLAVCSWRPIYGSFTRVCIEPSLVVASLAEIRRR